MHFYPLNSKWKIFAFKFFIKHNLNNKIMIKPKEKTSTYKLK